MLGSSPCDRLTLNIEKQQPKCSNQSIDARKKHSSKKMILCFYSQVSGFQWWNAVRTALEYRRNTSNADVLMGVQPTFILPLIIFHYMFKMYISKFRFPMLETPNAFQQGSLTLCILEIWLIGRSIMMTAIFHLIMIKDDKFSTTALQHTGDPKIQG